jgi:hypothetical protein
MSMLASLLRPCRIGWVALALFVLLMPIFAPTPATGQPEPDPKPGDTVYFHDADGLFTAEEISTLARDARLLQSSGIPTLVYVRTASASEAGHSESRSFADRVRDSWDIETSAGADDGLVLLVSWVPQNPLASTTVFSHGEHTFEGHGLTPETIQGTIDASVRSLVEQDRPFEAVVYLMRETRYNGIYSPPAPPAVEGFARTLNSALPVLGPLMALGTMGVLAAFTTSFWGVKPDPRRVTNIIIVTLAIVVALWSVSVWAQSRIGIASALVVLVALGIAAWTWSRLGFERHGSRPVRRRAVPSTHTLMRKRRQARAMPGRATGVHR